jgi:hypothetical protein
MVGNVEERHWIDEQEGEWEREREQEQGGAWREVL